MFKTRNKSCAGRYRSGHPVRNHEARRRGVGMFRRDKTPLSGALHRLFQGVLKHRPRSGLARLWHGGWHGCQAHQGKQPARPLLAQGTGLHSITPPGRPWPAAQAQASTTSKQKPPVGGFACVARGQATAVARLARGGVRVVDRAVLAMASVLACQPLAVSRRVTVKRSDSFKAVTMFLTCSCPLVWAV